jgi:PAS domain S-box-containing protein
VPDVEVLALVISCLMFGGLYWAAPAFRVLGQAHDDLIRESSFSDAVLITAGVLVVVLDRDGRIVRFNRQCELVTGYAFAEVKDRPPWDIFLLPDERDSVMQTWHDLREGNFPLERESHWLTKSGGQRLIAWSNTCLLGPDGEVDHVIATGVDVTEHRRDEARVRLDEARLRTLVELTEMADRPLREITDFAMESGVRLTNSTMGYLAFVNEDESVLTMHSWSAAAMARCATILVPIVYPMASTGLWGEAVRQRKPIITNDYAAPSPLKKGYPEGHVPLTRHMNVPVFDGDHIVAVAGVGNKADPYDEIDVIQLRLLMDGMWRLLHRKKVQEQLASANEELEARVQQRTAELARSNAELEQFAYVASHDLQEPLRKIVAFGDRLATKSKDTLSEEGLDYLRRVQNAATRMQDLINALLLYSRATTRAQPFTRVNLSALVQEVLGDLELPIEETGALVEVTELPTIDADPTQMRQLLQNLIANALKFRRPDVAPQVRISARILLPDEVTAALVTAADSAVELTFADNGIGFEPRFAERIFSLFQRLHARDEYAGTGIGLALCRKIAQRHGGTIAATGIPGEGSTFTVTLPLQHANGTDVPRGEAT